MKWAIIAALLALSFFVYTAVQDLQSITVTNFRVTGVHNVSLEGFTLTGELTVENPSYLSVTLRNISHEVLLENRVLTSGYLPAFTLHSGTNTIPFYQDVPFAPSAIFLQQMINQDEVIVSVEGAAVVDVFGITSFTLPYNSSIDIKKYLLDLVRESALTQAEKFGFTEEDIEQAKEEITEAKEQATDFVKGVIEVFT